MEELKSLDKKAFDKEKDWKVHLRANYHLKTKKS